MSATRTLFGQALPESWELVTVAEVASVVGGSTPKPKEPSYWAGDIPWIGVADLTGYESKRIAHGARSITQTGYDSCATQMLPKGSILFSSRAPIGYVAIAENPLCTSQGFKSLVLTNSLSADYVYWWLKTAKPLAEERAGGTTFKEISGKAMATLPIPLPPRAEQDRIVEAVESAMAAVDAGTRTVEEASELLGMLEFSVLASVFAAREADASKPTKKLGDVADHVLGKMLDKNKNKGTPRPYLRNINVQWGMIGTEDIKTMRITDSETERYAVKRGDLLVCEGGEPGRCAIWDSNDEIYFQKALHRVRSKGSNLNLRYAAYFLKFAARFGLLDRCLTGSTIKHLPGERLAEIPIPVPSRTLQDRAVEKIERELGALGRASSSIPASNDRAEDLRRSILYRAFTGQLVPQDPSDEPASELLERIKKERAQREAEANASKKRLRITKRASAAKGNASKSPRNAASAP